MIEQHVTTCAWKLWISLRYVTCVKYSWEKIGSIELLENANESSLSMLCVFNLLCFLAGTFQNVYGRLW